MILDWRYVKQNLKYKERQFAYTLYFSFIVVFRAIYYAGQMQIHVLFLFLYYLLVRFYLILLFRFELCCSYIILKLQKMKYSKIGPVDTISQWRDADIKYEYLRVFIVALQRMLDGIIEYEEKLKSQSNRNIIIQKNDLIKKGQEHVKHLKLIAAEVNMMFYKQLKTQLQISKILCTIKLEEVSLHSEMCFKYDLVADQTQKKNILIRFVEYTYIQTVYLSSQLEESEDQERRALKKHRKTVQKNLETFQPEMTQFIKIPSKNVSQIISNLQKLYIQLRMQAGTQKFTKKLARTLKRQEQKTLKEELRTYPVTDTPQSKHTFIFGLLVGLFIAVIVFMSILLTYRGQSVEQDPLFNRDFPVWRGMAFIILYIWVLGFNAYYFQEYRISPHVILDYTDHHRITYTKLFNIAGFFSTLFSLLFCLYALSISKIINFGQFPERYLALILWLFFILFMINPLPTKYHKSRMYIFKTMGQILVSPFFPITAAIGLFTDQMQSLITSFGDLAYSICYFTSLDFDNYSSKNNICKRPAAVASFVYVLWLLTLKSLHCFRKGYDNKKFLWTVDFWGLFKYIFSIITTVLSFIWTGSTDAIFIVWIIFTILGTVYAYGWDLKVDFGLLNRKAKNWMLRNKIMYAPFVYYLIIVGNLALRLFWILTLSPNIAQKGFGSPQLFKLVTGGLEILRRGLWNLVKMENQHIMLCDQMRALPKNYYTLKSKILEKLKLKINTNSSENNHPQLDIKLKMSDSINFKNDLKNSVENLNSNEELQEKIDLHQDYTIQKLQKKISEYENERSSTTMLLKQKIGQAQQNLNKLKEIASVFDKE